MSSTVSCLPNWNGVISSASRRVVSVQRTPPVVCTHLYPSLLSAASLIFVGTWVGRLLCQGMFVDGGEVVYAG